MECFYRISTKVILKNPNKDEFVVIKNSKGEYELPGGGIEHGESVGLSIKRELQEELGIDIDIHENDLKPIFFDVYKSRSHDIWVAFVVYEIEIKNILDSHQKTIFSRILLDSEKNYVPYLWHLAKQSQKKQVKKRGS